MNKPHYKFSLSIDLGAKNTGIFMVSHPVGELPTSKNCKAVTLITTPVEEGGGFSIRQRSELLLDID